MPHDPEAFADMVVMTVKAAMAPVLADVKSLQTQIAGWESRWNDLGTLRERVAVVEAKEQRPAPEAVEPVDLTPVLERLAVAESKLAVLPAAEKTIGELRDRVLTFETKASTPLPTLEAKADVDLTPVLERLASAEALLKAQGDLRDRVLVVETKTAAPSPPDPVVYDVRDRVLALESKSLPAFEVPADLLSRLSVLEARPLPTLAEKSVDLTPVELRLTRLELQHEVKAAELTPLSASLADLTKDVGAMRERLAVVEVRPSVPGPPGESGPPGTNGVDGKDGLAGLSFEGVYQEGQTYEKGQLATWGGSSWHCNATTTTKPGDGSKDWTLMVKRGRDGKDGMHAPGALPVISVGSRA